MGFGLILLGVALIAFAEAGFGVIGYPLICIGCMKLYKLHDDFKACAILSLLNIPYTVASALTMFNVLPKNNIVTNVLDTAHFVFSAAMIWMFCMRIRQIALEGGDERLATTALRNGLFAAMYYIWTIAVLLIPFIRNTVIVGILVLFKYLLAVLGVLFMLSCGSKITTASQMAKESIPAPPSVKEKKKK